jgi:uncharacterized repeat protein (TIGR02543 family)
MYVKDIATGYSITYEENGGTTVTDLTAQTNLPTPLPTITKSGYVFRGWFTDSAFTTKAIAGATLSTNTTLYAKWNTLANELTLLNNNKQSIKTALTNKGKLPTDDMSTYGTLIESIAGSIAYNIEFGDVAPVDTTKLWCKCIEPDKVIINEDIINQGEGTIVVKKTGALANTDESPIVTVIGDYEYYIYTTTFKRLNIITNQLTTLTLATSIGGLQKGISYSVYNGCIYVIGDYTSLVYPPTDGNKAVVRISNLESTPVVETLGYLTYSAYRGRSIIHNNILYVMGGQRMQSSTYTLTHSYLQKFDLGTNTCTGTILVNSYYGTQDLDMAVVGDYIYIFGGYDYSYNGSTYRNYTTSNYIFRYNTISGNVETLSLRLPHKMASMSSFVFGSNIYIFGGLNLDASTSASLGTAYLYNIYKYDTIAQTITSIGTLDYKFMSKRPVALGNEALLLAVGDMSQDIHSYRIVFDLPENNLLITNRTKNSVVIINTSSLQLKTRVDNVFLGNVSNNGQLVESYIYNGSQWVLV